MLVYKLELRVGVSILVRNESAESDVTCIILVCGGEVRPGDLEAGNRLTDSLESRERDPV